ncbi:MAG TPA: ubiquitin-conjugating enzyme E2 [Planctomycetota bacterium]|nr:ubiquitin-conjugating enzyme E2 [Planctomycetota bacterium]
MPFFDTPRVRRLKADAEALKALKENSSILEYQAHGDPAERYLVTLKGKGLIRKSEGDPVEVAEVHRVEIRLGIDYPRSRPDLQWLTSIYHPNISAVGAVCLGGYSTNWVPSLGLAELCEMLWDMVRYANYDPKSAYNYSAGRWSETQTQYDLPLDPRNLRDRLTKTVGDNIIRFSSPSAAPAPFPKAPPREAPPIVKPPEEDILIINDDTTPASLPPPRPPAFRPQPRPRAADDDILIIE